MLVVSHPGSHWTFISRPLLTSNRKCLGDIAKSPFGEPSRPRLSFNIMSHIHNVSLGESVQTAISECPRLGSRGSEHSFSSSGGWMT